MASYGVRLIEALAQRDAAENKAAAAMQEAEAKVIWVTPLFPVPLLGC